MRSYTNRSTSRTGGGVRLVGGSGGTITGLSRYASGLYDGLLTIGMSPEIVFPSSPKIASAISPLMRRMGYDVVGFFNRYPLYLSDTNKSIITHLTSQNIASVNVWRSKSPLITTVHDLIPLIYRNDKRMTGYMRFYDRFFNNLSMCGVRNSDILIAISENTKGDIVQMLGYPEEKIRVVYSGIDHQLFRPAPISSHFVERYGLLGDGPFILYVGSEDPRKNLRQLIDAFKLVMVEFPDAQLLKVGAIHFEDERRVLQNYASSMGVISNLRFIDQVSNDDLVMFYNFADLFVLPSLYEGFGFPVLEAMACGTPVVASNCSSLPEIVGNAAVLVNPQDVQELAAAIQNILTDSALAADMGSKGIRQASKFTWERTARETVLIYESILGIDIRVTY